METIVIVGAVATVLGSVVTAFLTFRTTRTDVSAHTIEAYKARLDLMDTQQTIPRYPASRSPSRSCPRRCPS